MMNETAALETAGALMTGNTLPDAATAPESTPDSTSEITYDLTPPEGGFIAPDAIERIVSWAKERGLSNEDAQALLDREVEVANTHTEHAQAKLAEQQTMWVEEIRADKEIGGANFEANVQMAKEAVTAFGGDKVREILNLTSLGSHPEVVRMFVKLGKAMKSDRFVKGGEAVPQRDVGSILYDNTKKE